ncbi:MAG: capsule biosynthesis protein CapK, partial [Verrucomicrobium sp.]
MTDDPVPTDQDRFPTLTPAGRRVLDFMKEHPHAPVYRNESGNRLLPQEVAQVRAFESEVAVGSIDWTPGAPPRWLESFVARTYAEVPHYRRLGAPPTRFTDIPSLSLADLSRDIAAYVPDSVPVDRLMNFRTSGTSGHPLLLDSQPVVA